MKVVVSSPGRYHSFDMAAELEARGALLRLYTGHAPFRRQDPRIPRRKVEHIWPLHTLHLATARVEHLWPVPWIQRELHEIARAHMDRLVSRRIGDADVLIALSGSGLASGRAVQARGGVYVCDRGSSHIVFQDRILQEEAAILGVRPTPIHPAAVAREQAEYAQADAIFVPSDFVRDTFLGEGVSPEKLRLVPYGVDTSAFRPVGSPPEHFQALFAGGLSSRKGLHYLLKAWRDWGHPTAQLRLAGAPAAEFDDLVRWAGGMPQNVTLLGHLSRAALAQEMSSAHVLVLPSIEEGLALVQAQAMACGAAVVATTNTGAATLFEHGREGLIGPIRSVDFLVDAFERLSGDRARLARMRRNALARSATFGSVAAYGDRVAAALGSDLAGARGRPRQVA